MRVATPRAGPEFRTMFLPAREKRKNDPAMASNCNLADFPTCTTPNGFYMSVPLCQDSGQWTCLNWKNPGALTISCSDLGDYCPEGWSNTGSSTMSGCCCSDQNPSKCALFN